MNVADSVNIRAMFRPDPGYVLIECDYEKADVFTVVWEADDQELKEELRRDPDGFYDRVTSGIELPYALRKRFIHLTNYGGSARTAAIACGIPIARAQGLQAVWMNAHPGIVEWHNRTRAALQRNPPEIRNRFGFRKLYWGPQDDAMLREALAWQPQSTVAICTGKAHVAIDTELPWVQVLLDGHDSLVMQIPLDMWPHRNAIRDRMEIIVPYPDPMPMVCSLKASTTSWADCRRMDWA